MGLSPTSPELRDFFDRVVQFYTESTEFMVKYFKTGLSSMTLKYLSVLDISAKNLNLDALRKRWLYLTEKFPNVVSTDEAEDLRLELVDYKKLKDPVENISVDEWFAQVASLQVVGEQRFPVLTKLALALATFYYSSSEAERDFYKQNLIHSDKKRCLMLLNCQSIVKGVQLRVRRENRREKKAREFRFLRPDPELLALLRNSVPSQRYKEFMKDKKEEEITRKDTEVFNRHLDKKDSDTDLLREVRLLKRRIQDKAVNDLRYAKRPKLAGTVNGGVKEDGADGVRNPKDKNFKGAAVAGVINAKDVNNLEEVAVKAVRGEEEAVAGVSNPRDGVSNGVARAVKGKEGAAAASSGAKGGSKSVKGKKRSAVVPTKKAQKRKEQVDRLLWLVQNQ